MTNDPVATARGSDTMTGLSYFLKIPFNLFTIDLTFDGFSSFFRSGFFSLFGVGIGDGEADASGLGEAMLATLVFAA